MQGDPTPPHLAIPILLPYLTDNDHMAAYRRKGKLIGDKVEIVPVDVMTTHLRCKFIGRLIDP